MSGPAILKRLAAAAGLALMIPIGLGLVDGTLTPIDAARRAGALFVAVVIARKLAVLAPGRTEVLLPAPGAGRPVTLARTAEEGD
jgi:hypothetical protein